MARYKYDLQYEIRLNSNAWIDISALADSRKLSIQRNSCTTEFKSAIDSASFTLQPKPALYDLRAEVVNILMEATDNANHAYVRISKRNTMPDEDPVIFLGVVDASSISITTLRIPQAITIQCQDISIVNLDNAPSQYIVLENKKTSEIVKTLIEHAGFVVGSVDIKAEDDVYHRAFVAYSDKDDTYRDYIDTLLFEAGGYALDCGKNGLMNIIRIRIGENTEGARLVDNYLDAEGINSSTSILDSDGIKLKWSTIAETHPDSPQTVYVDDINREIDDETGILKGEEIAPGGYWPEDGNVDKTYFEYEAEFLDREYQSGQKKNVNEDLSLILVKNTSASINVWTEDGVQLNPEEVFDYPIPAGFEEETNPAYYPDKAWWLLHNKSGQNLNLTSFSIQGDCIYRDRINTLLMPSTSAKPEEYESVYIYTAEQAQQFARFYHDIKKYARTRHSWSELGIVEVGSLVKIAHKTTDIGQVAYVVQVTYSYIGDRIKSDCIAISIGPYNEYNFRQWGQNNGANDSSAAISSITDYYLASSEYQGVTVNTPGWSTDADYGADDSKPYLWKYTKTQYVNGKVENSKPVIIAVKGDAKTIKSIATEYALADSSVTPPAEDSDAWQDTIPAKTDQGQSIWKRTVITYSDGTIEYTDTIVLSGLIVFQYAYGKSAVNPPTPSIWIWGKKFMVWGNLFISSEGSAIWSATRPEKPEGQWYLWMRISTDGGQTWNDPVCISGNDAIGYELSYSPATYQMTDRGIVKTRGQYIDFFLDISNIPYNANDIVWNVEANGETPLVKGTDWDILDNDPTQIRVTFPYNFKSTSFTVSVVITGYEDMAKTRTVGATILENSTAEYLDVVTELPEDGDNVTSRGPLKDGDYILLETINENDKQERIPYRWTVVEGIGKWVPVGGDNRPSNYAEIMAGSLADALKSDITQNSVNAFYGFIRDLVSQNATIINLFSEFIKVLAAIFGGDYEVDELTEQVVHIDDPSRQKYGGRGFAIDKNGLLRAVKAELDELRATNAYIQGVLDSQALYTRDPIDQKITVTTPLQTTLSFVSVYTCQDDESAQGRNGRNFSFELKDNEYTYFLEGTIIKRISHEHGTIETQSTNISIGDTDLYPYIDVNDKAKAIVFNSGMYIPGITQAGTWNMWVGTSFAGMKKITELKTAASSSPFIGYVDNLVVVNEAWTCVELNGTNRDGIWAKSTVDSTVLAILTSNSFSNYGDPLSSSWESGSVPDILIVATDGRLYSQNVILPAPDMETQERSIELPIDLTHTALYPWLMYKAGTDVMFLQKKGRTVSLYRLTSFSASAFSTIYSFNFADHFTQENLSDTFCMHTYVNDMNIFSAYNTADKKMFIASSPDFYSFDEYELNIDLSPYWGYGSSNELVCPIAYYKTFLLVCTGKQFIQISFSADNIIDELNSLEEKPLSFRCSVTCLMSYDGQRRSAVSMLCTETTLSIEFSDGEEITLEKGKEYALPIIIHSLTIDSNMAACITKDIIPEANKGFNIGFSGARFNAYLDRLDANSIKANELPDYSDSLVNGTVYKDSSGNLKIKQ